MSHPILPVCSPPLNNFPRRPWICPGHHGHHARHRHQGGRDDAGGLAEAGGVGGGAAARRRCREVDATVSIGIIPSMETWMNMDEHGIIGPFYKHI